MDHTGTLAHQTWPIWDEALCQGDSVEIGVQVNGRVRGHVVLSRTASEDAALTAALGADGVAAHLAGRTVKKVVYVPGKIVNVVVGLVALGFLNPVIAAFVLDSARLLRG